LIFQDLPYSFIAYFPYFEKLRKGLWDHLAVCLHILPYRYQETAL
jgi:hypothetical protein